MRFHSQTHPKRKLAWFSVIGITATLLISILILSGCGHQHAWVDATCTEPKTCSECGKTDGEALGHTWTDATCADPKTCSVCGKTEGEPLGHNVPDLTCTTDAVCTRCGENVPAPGHQLTEATCTEPPMCEVCGEILGEPLGHTTASGICERCRADIYPAKVPDAVLAAVVQDIWEEVQSEFNLGAYNSLTYETNHSYDNDAHWNTVGFELNANYPYGTLVVYCTKTYEYNRSSDL